MKIIISYSEPDLDGTSCMFAYSELLNKLGEKADYIVRDIPKQEVGIVCDIFGIELKGTKIDEIPENSEFVLVDLNGVEQIYDSVKNDEIIEIIDHHGLSRWLQSYNNLQRLQIDRVGAAATIVTERYKASGFTPSRESAILLFYGIISNTINLKSNITNKRDIEACKWLKSVCDEISEEKIKEIFIKKSVIKDENLRSEMECGIANTFNDFKTIVGQIELANLEEFLNKKKDRMLEILKQVKKEKKINYIFINCVDILNGYTIIFTPDEESNEFVERTYGYKFDENNEVRINKVVQRKELTKILREKYN